MRPNTTTLCSLFALCPHIYVIRMSTDIELTKVSVAELQPRMRNLIVIFKVLEKGEPREVSSRRDGETHRVADAIVGDSSGTVTIPLWDDAIDSFEPGKIYELKNAHTGLFQGYLRLKLGRDSEILESEAEIEEVNSEVDMSAERHERQRRYGGYRGRRGGYDRDRGYDRYERDG